MHYWKGHYCKMHYWKGPLLQNALLGKITPHVFKQVLLRIPEDTFSSTKIVERQLSNRGGPKTKLVSFDDAILLVMVLPGKVARETRVQFRDIIRSFMGGDQSLHAKIDANAQSNSPIAQMARASMATEQDPLSLTHKRKMEELDIERQEVDIARQRNEIARQRIEMEGQKVEIENQRIEMEKKRVEMEKTRAESDTQRMVTIANGYSELCKNTVIDERARLIFKDYYLNMTMSNQSSAGSTQGLLTNGETVSPNKPISLSQVAHELSLKIPDNKLIAIGMELKKKYVKRHGKEPSKHDQLCGGRMTKVNTYSEGDRDLMEEVLRSHAKK